MSKVGNFFKKRKGAILSMLGSLAMLAAAGGVGVFCALYQTYSPDKYMEDYYECFINESYAALYKSANIEESEFISLESFNQMMVNNYGYEETDRYSISEMSRLGPYAQSMVSFIDSETSDKVEWKLKLEKADEKKYLFFSDWIVNLDEFIVEKVKLVAPTGVDIIIDDKNITQEKIKGVRKTVDEETGMVSYIIDRMFVGDHNIMYVGTHTQPESVIVTVDEDSEFYAFREGDVKAEIQESISASVTDIVVGMYNAVFLQEGTDNVKTKFATKDGVQHNLDTTYIAMVAAANQDNGATLESIDITYYSMKFDRYDYDGDISVRFYYTSKFEAKYPRVMDGGVVIDGVRQSYVGEVDSEAVVTYEYIDEKWQAVSIDMKCIDYGEEHKIEVEEEEQ